MDTKPRQQTQAVALPANRAFVIQFSSTATGQPTSCTGRVEHLVSGHRMHFQSWEELQHFITQELKQAASTLRLQS